MDSILNIASFVQNNEFQVTARVSFSDKVGDEVYIKTPYGGELETSHIVEIQVFNKLNEFMQTGHLVYVDDKQVLDKLLGKTLCYLDVGIQQTIRPIDSGKSTSSNLSSKRSFNGRFLVDTIDVIDRRKDRITYRLSFVDDSYLDLTRNLAYSTYKKNMDNPVNVGEILKDLFAQAKLKISQDTLKGIGSNLRYITRTNDNLMTAFRFLMRRDFYAEQGRSEALNILLNNTNRGEYGIYNLLDPDRNWVNDPRYVSENGVDFSMFTQETLEQIGRNSSLENGLETLNLRSRLQVLDSLHGITVPTFSQESNSFGEYKIETKEIAKYLGNAKGEGFQKRYSESPEIFGKTHFRECPEWNNDMNVYEDQVENLLNFDSVVVITDGSANRIPGMDFGIFIRTPDVGTKNMGDPDMAEAQKENDVKLQRFCGAWTISSVRHVIRPSEGTFRDSICLFRNMN